MTTTAHPKLEGLDRYKFGWSDSDAAGVSERRGLSLHHETSGLSANALAGTTSALPEITLAGSERLQTAKGR